MLFFLNTRVFAENGLNVSPPVAMGSMGPHGAHGIMGTMGELGATTTEFPTFAVAVFTRRSSISFFSTGT